MVFQTVGILAILSYVAQFSSLEDLMTASLIPIIHINGFMKQLRNNE